MEYQASKYDHLRPNVGVTVVPFIYKDESLKVLVYLRPEDADEFPGAYALPNCFYNIEKHENTEQAANEALSLKTSVSIPYLEQLHTFSGNHIDPNRINTINICYFALLRENNILPSGSGQFETKWVSVEYALNNLDFAFNHKEVLEKAYDRVKAKAEYKPVACFLLKKKFTIAKFRDITSDLLGITLDNSIFRDKIKQSDILIECTGEKDTETSGRPAQLYSFNSGHTGYFYPRALTKVGSKKK